MSINLMKSLKTAAVAALLYVAGTANAALLQFTVSGDYSASWRLNSTVLADDGAEGLGFVLYDVVGDFPGAVFGVSDLYFYNASQAGGLEIYDYYNDFDLLFTDGPQLYTRSEEDLITFRLGTFNLTEFGGSGRYTLTIADVDAGPGEVPEPATGAMLLGGLGLMYALRKRRQVK